MSRAVAFAAKWVLGLILVTVVGGCPDDRPALVTNTGRLDFGETQTELQFVVTKSLTSRGTPPIVVRSDAQGVTILDCNDPADACASAGPLDPLVIRIRADRSLMELGENEGQISVTSEGLVTKRVAIRAFTPVVANLNVNNHAPLANDEVQFSDASEVSPGWVVTAWRWEFGDGRGSVSTQQPPPLYRYRDAGSFTVSLTVTATKGAAQIVQKAERPGFVVVTDRVAPEAAFEVSETDIAVDTQVRFTDLSVPGTAAITAWEWDFGDGESSPQRNPLHTYTVGGSFDVSLRVVSAHGANELVRAALVNVTAIPPVANFDVNNRNPTVGTSVQFTDTSVDGSANITAWIWSFGDGGISTLQNPLHEYAEPGTYGVRLTVTSRHGSDTETKGNFITVSIVAPSAAFDSSTQRPLAGDPVEFEDASTRGTADIESWSWDFGDGGLSSEQNPTHVYAAPGEYEVSLAVTSEHGTDTEVQPGFIAVFAPTALDTYVRKPDPSYAYSVVATENNVAGFPGLRGHVLSMHSQEWRTTGDVDRPGWDHWLTIIEPAFVLHPTALLFITGGSTNTPPGSAGEIAALAPLAALTGSVVAVIEQVPNEPLQFDGENFTRTEDAIIAHTFAQFLDSFDSGDPDNEWPALLPMTKAAVRALDTVQTFLDDDRATGKVVIDDFVVSGASKRGWTTWLTGATDTRVKAIAPLVFDILNMVPQLEHHFNVYGFYSEAVGDYVEAGVFDRIDTAAGAALRAIVDPYEYRDRFATVPKLMINSTGDQFFLPDSGQFSFEGLPGEKKLAYLPNTDHGLDGDAVVQVLVPWYVSMLRDIELPQFAWEFTGNRLIVTPAVPAASARLWFASSPNRDFRFDEALNAFTPPVWSSIDLGQPNGLGQFIYTSVDATSPPRWTGFFIQLVFDSNITVGTDEAPYIFTTEIRVTPEAYPDHGAR